MGVMDRWFRRRPSDDEMREELESHVAMRAAHDRVDETAARRRLGNVLRTRERMRQVWIAEWCDALRQDAWFTWRSWRRQPGFALGAILVLALGLGASTSLFAALDRVLFRPLPYADPDRLVSVGRLTVPLMWEGQTELIPNTFYVQEWDTPPEPFQSVTAMLEGVSGPCQIAERQPIERPWYTVVGVIADVRNAQALTDAPNPEIYIAAQPGRWMQLLPRGSQGGHLSIRTTARPADAAVFLRQIVADIDPRQLVTIQTSEDLLTTLTAQPRFITSLLTAFAALALLLAAAGLYSVAAYLVTQRRRDIGVRIAVGAAPRDVARQVVGEAGRWIAAGALLGCALGWLGTRALQSQLYEVDALDPWSWAGALFALALVLVIVVFRPAYRAAHVDPIAALRAE
jgi:hypothetical protein